MRPCKLTSAESFWYDLTFAGVLIRRVPALEYDRGAAQVLRANDLFETQCKQIARNGKCYLNPQQK